MTNSRRVLITGGRGVIGKALYQELITAGYKSVTVLNSDQADLIDYSATLKVFKQIKPALVFHLAAKVYGIMGNLMNKAQAYIENTRINTNVIEAAYQCGAKKIVAMGSAAVYSDSIKLPMVEEDIWNGPPHYSEAAYAHSKRGMLAQLEAYQEQYGIDFAFCISTNLYGPFDKFDEKWGHVIPSLISKFYKGVTEGAEVSVWGTGEARRDFLFSEDAAHAMRLIGEEFVGPINLATGQSHTIKETVEVIKRVSGYLQDVNWDSSKPDGQKLRDYDVTKLKSLSFKPKNDIEQGLAKTFKWYADNVHQARR